MLPPSRHPREYLMPESYPYIVSNNKIEPILAKIRSAARPERFSRETLNKWGFTASNDRAMLGVLKELGFLNESGTPTDFYDRLRDPNDWKYVLAERMRDLYGELFATDTNVNVAPDAEVRGTISRITGKDDESAKRYFATFKTLAGMANFDPKPLKAGASEEKKPNDEPEKKTKTEPLRERVEGRQFKAEVPDFHYNIQIHLPVTTDITVYNAIFKSLKEHLGVS